MKREHGESADYGGHKRSRGGRFEVRVLVASKVAGSVIGKGGANIQKLRSDHNAQVRIPDAPGPERIMAVATAEPDTAAVLLEDALRYMADESSGRSGRPDNNGDVEIRLLIHQSIVGGIIGRAGFKIKEIRESSGAAVKVFANCAPQSSDRCVSVAGKPEKIGSALKQIFEVVSSTDIKGQDQPYDAVNFDAFFAHEYGGYGSEADAHGGAAGGFPMGRGMPPHPPRGMSMRRGDGGFHPRGGPHMFGAENDGEDFAFGGGPQGRFGAGGGGFDSAFGRGRFSGGGNRGGGFGGRGGRGGGGGGFGQGGGGFEHEEFDGRYGGGRMGGHEPGGPTDYDNGEVETTQVTIPKEMAGAIIGPGGSRIRKIRGDSRASITIDEPPPGSNERIITITGTKNQIQLAQYLLQQSVREHAAGPAGPAGPAEPRGRRY